MIVTQTINEVSFAYSAISQKYDLCRMISLSTFNCLLHFTQKCEKNKYTVLQDYSYMIKYQIFNKSMTELFKGYEQQFFNNLNSTNRKIQAISVQSNQKKQMAFVDIKEDLTQCQKTLKLMETQMNSLDVQMKFEYSRKVRGYKKDYDDCRKKLYKAEEQFAYEKNKEMLLGAQLDEEKSYKGKEKLLKNGQLLSDANEKLKDSVRVMHETQQISNTVQVELIDHSQKMKRNKQKLLEMRDDLGHSEHKIKSIMGRVRKNKLILVGVLATIAIVGIIVLIIHFTNK